MAQIPLFVGQLTGANLGSSNLDNAGPVQGDANAMPFALIVVVDITAFTGTSIALQPLLVDPVSGKKLVYGAASGTMTGISTKAYVVGSTGVATAVAGDVLGAVNLPVPSFWTMRIVPVAVTNITATVTAYTVPLIN